ncbi:succinylglutamate desuccinylase/aspartoacylase family protein, partial [Patescibacteria group bacterium]|nr:succinylglutamate desuccinylase/aspartoacylase family protein [Patescibacteria group bacterium]
MGVEVVKRLSKQGLAKYFDYLVANPRAFAKDKEFIDTNLNRSYPGKKESSLYEERKAYENFQIAKKYKYI